MSPLCELMKDIESELENIETLLLENDVNKALMKVSQVRLKLSQMVAREGGILSDTSRI